MFSFLITKVLVMLCCLSCFIIGKEIFKCVRCICKYEQYNPSTRDLWLAVLSVSYLITILTTGINATN